MAGKRRYLLFCARANLNPLPATEATLCHFVAHLSTGLSPSPGTSQQFGTCRLRQVSQRGVPASSICPQRSQQEPGGLREAQETANYP